MKRAIAVVLAAAVAVILAAGLFVSAWLSSATPLQSETAFDVRAGSPFAVISRELAAEGIIDHPRLFTWYARLSGTAGQVHVGEYLIRPGATPRSLLAQLTSGEVRLHSFTIVEGWNVRELLAALSGHAVLESTLTDDDWPALLERLGAAYTSPEGLFLPETYRFPRGTTDEEVLVQAHEFLKEALAEEWENRAPDLPLASPYEALTLASIIEKETGLAEERARIAGVFVRRLQKGMRLQTDPTVIYGVGAGFDGNLTRRHLRTDTPYNTYTRRGLPPGPIALPGRAAIHAALHPADGDELYFVATGLGDGSHKFSATREEHEQAVEEYLARERARRNGNAR